MVPTRNSYQAWKPWAFIGAASLGLTVLSSQPASALGTYGLDNTNGGTNSLSGTMGRYALSSTQSYLRTFKMGPLDGYLKNIGFAYSTPSASNQSLILSIFEVNTSIPNTPTSSTPLATSTFSITGTNGHGLPDYEDLTSLSSLGNVLFKANKTYGIEFGSPSTSAAGPLGLRHCAAVALCDGATFQTAGGITIPIVTGQTTAYIGSIAGGWTAASTTVRTAYMDINFTPVPAPALMGFSSLSGLMVYSRRLRSRIKGSVA
jgi:hypothetical protein